ncbi:MAG: hypothetical protein OQK97_10725, partial [Deltaproteobacteria bacterium]|nr:hypothetical protein [Deltaproteobacteria bacterium]
MPEAENQKITRLSSLCQKQIFNRLNSLHYQGTALRICLLHKNNKRCIYLTAEIDPITDESATATWIRDDNFPSNLFAFDLIKIILPSSWNSYEFRPVKYHFGERVLHFTVPELAVEADFRKQQRFICAEKNIPVTLTQNAIVFKGRLLDYSAAGIQVDLDCDDGSPFAWLNNSLTAMLTIMPENNPVYTGQV